MHMGPRLARRASRALPALKLAVVLLAAVSLHARALESPGLSANNPPPRYDNTYAKDFIMDAPWRVQDVETPIPLTIVLKDCDVDDIRELHWICCWDVTAGGSVPLWNHDFGDETIGDDPSEQDYWAYISEVTEGHPSLPDGALLTPANLGYQAGDAIQLKVSIYYRDNWFNYTETRYLRVHVGSGPFPWPAGWYGGDTHCHSMYTNNIAEFGAPLPAVRLAAQAVGLHWLTITDHSCDLRNRHLRSRRLRLRFVLGRTGRGHRRVRRPRLAPLSRGRAELGLGRQRLLSEDDSLPGLQSRIPRLALERRLRRAPGHAHLARRPRPACARRLRVRRPSFK
jgi:hypothetical protein